MTAQLLSPGHLRSKSVVQQGDRSPKLDLFKVLLDMSSYADKASLHAVCFLSSCSMMATITPSELGSRSPS